MVIVKLPPLRHKATGVAVRVLLRRLRKEGIVQGGQALCRPDFTDNNRDVQRTGGEKHLTSIISIRLPPDATSGRSSDDSRSQHRLSFSIHERPPQPFKRAISKPPQPPAGVQTLDEVHRYTQRGSTYRMHGAEESEAVPEKYPTENQRLNDVVRECHAAKGLGPRERPPPMSEFDNTHDNGDIPERHGDLCHCVNNGS
jgi:hypothetical protein